MNFMQELKELNYKIRIFGRHYSPRGNKFQADNRCIESCRRIYRADESPKMDGSNNCGDQRRYEFALIEEKDHSLIAYNGNPNKTAN